jgi:hypothetical protein
MLVDFSPAFTFSPTIRRSSGVEKNRKNRKDILTGRRGHLVYSPWPIEKVIFLKNNLRAFGSGKR